jgi:hypothetical protein
MTNKMRRYGLIAGLLSLGWVGHAAAMPGCEGTYAAESLRPLPARLVVDLDIRDPSPDHLRLAKRFLAGMSDAGVASGPKPNVLISIRSSRLDTSSGRGGSGTEANSPGFSGLQESFHQSLPAMPDTRLGSTSSPPPPPTMLFHVEATEPNAARASWVANVQCNVTGTDDGALAQDLGRIMGGVLGRRVERGPL